MFRQSVPILMYHRVTDEDVSAYAERAAVLGGMTTSRASFASQMAWLARRGFEAISLNDLINARANQRPLPRRPVIITFDDGYQDVADNAVPILQQHGFTAHVFLIPGLVGRTSEWDMADYEWAFPLFDWETARELESKGFSCDAHTMTHPKLPTLGLAECRREVEESRYVLKQELGREIRHFAYPFGLYDEMSRSIVREAGFDSACSTRRRLSGQYDDPWALHRLCVHWDDALFDFKCSVRTGFPVLSGVRRRFANVAAKIRLG